jgi:hypothetical protein
MKFNLNEDGSKYLRVIPGTDNRGQYILIVLEEGGQLNI